MLTLALIIVGVFVLLSLNVAPGAASATAPSTGLAKIEEPATIPDGGIMLFQREIGSLPYKNNALRSYNINQAPNMLKTMMLHFECVATFNDIAPMVLPIDAPFNMLKNIQYKTSEGLVMKNFSAFQIAMLSNYERGTPALNTAPASLQVGANAFSFDVYIPFEDWTNQYPERTALNTNSYNDSTVYGTWADLAVAWPGWDNARDDLEVDCRIVTLERQPLGPADKMLARQQMIDNFTKVDINAPSSLLPENTKMKTLMVVTRDASGVRQNDMLAKIKVTFDSGAYSVRDLRPGAIQSQNKQYYNVELIETGVYIIEFDQTHDFRTLLNTTDRNFTNIEFEANAAQTGTITILRRRIETPKIMTG